VKTTLEFALQQDEMKQELIDYMKQLMAKHENAEVKII